MPIVTITNSMEGKDSNGSILALFLRTNRVGGLWSYVSGASTTDFIKIGLIDTASLSIDTTVLKREAENSKLAIKTIGQKKDRMLSVDALVPTNSVLCCSYGYIADYYAALGVDVPDDATGFDAEAMLVLLDEDENWDATASLAHYGIEWWKSVRIVPTGSKTFDGTSSHIEPFEVHLQRDASGESLRRIPANDGSGIDVTNEYVDFSSVTA